VAILPADTLTHASHLMIVHGRRTSVARKPACPMCPVRTLCPWPHKTRGAADA
jgi:endonuclease-3